MTRRRATVRASFPVTVVAVLLVGCASSGADDAAPTSAPVTVATAPTTTAATTSAAVTTAGGPTTASPTAAAPTTLGPTTAVPSPNEPTTTVPPAPPVSATPPAIASPPTTLVPPPLLADLATDPAGLAGQLTEALRTILDDAAPAERVSAAGRRQQLVYRRLAARREWQEAVLAAVPPDLRTYVANDLTAANAPGDPALARPVPPLENLPAWTIRAPLPAAELRGYYDEGAAATGIPWTYLAAINFVETRMGRIVGLSSADAIGPMQFLRSTWDACCEGDPTADRDAIIGAAVYLQRRGGPVDMRRAVLGYNPNDAYLTMIDRYATNLAFEPRLYRGYHAWQVFVSSVAGPVRLPEGFATDVPIPAAEYVAAHPQDRA